MLAILAELLYLNMVASVMPWSRWASVFCPNAFKFTQKPIQLHKLDFLLSHADQDRRQLHNWK
jgi:hypothetical protein